MNEEIWKDVVGYEGTFQVSNQGRLKSFFRKEPIIRKIHANKAGYIQITFQINKKRINKQIHRFVAEAFIPNPENKPHVNHINGIKTDNRLENLEWCTHSENMKHAYKMKLITSKTGKNSARYKGDILVYTLKGIYVLTLRGTKHILESGFQPKKVYECVNGKRKLYKGYIFKRLNTPFPPSNQGELF
jgi:hypothetical protein